MCFNTVEFSAAESSKSFLVFIIFININKCNVNIMNTTITTTTTLVEVAAAAVLFIIILILHYYFL